jgi:hypothetical protein
MTPHDPSPTPHAALTPRDIQVVLAVHDHRVLRRDQIQRLLFPSKNTANARLHHLHTRGYLARRRLPVAYGAGSGQALYLLTARGAALVAAERGLDVEGIGWRRGHNHVSALFLEHTLMINDVRIALTLAARAAGGSVEGWVREDGLRATAEPVWIEDEDGRPRRVALVPDAYGELILGRRRAPIYLEVDRATEAQRRWARKVAAYLAHVRAGAYTRRSGRTALRVLTVTTSTARRDNLCRTTAGAGGEGAAMFWFTTLDHLTAATALYAPIWQVPGETAPQTLFTPAPGPLR